MAHENIFGVVPSPIPATEKKYKSIFNPGVARHLIKMGNVVADIKGDHFNPVKTIFLFEITDKFQADLDVILTNAANNK